jgi:hypothetical protein
MRELATAHADKCLSLSATPKPHGRFRIPRRKWNAKLSFDFSVHAASVFSPRI